MPSRIDQAPAKLVQVTSAALKFQGRAAEGVEMSLSSHFERLGAPLTNSRWSWGAVGGNGAVYLRVWQDRVVRRDGKQLVEVTHQEKYGDGRGRDNLGYAERLRHVGLIRDGAPSFMVMCLSTAPHAPDSPREIQSYNEKDLFVGGDLHELDGDFWLEIVDRVPVAGHR